MTSSWLKRILYTTTILFVAILGFNVYAATTISNGYDQPSSLKVSEGSNHKFVITTSENIDEGDTLTFIFPSSFDTSTIIEDDVDIDDDGTDLTTASDCTGTEQASVGIASDTITITICSGDGGAVASASVVTVEIGTNAITSGSGINKIINPDNPATYFIGIAGTSGMSGSIPMPIVTDDDSSVGAVVADSSSGGSGGSGGTTPSDTVDTTTDDDTVTDDTVVDDVVTDDTTTDDDTVTDDTVVDDVVTDDTTTDDNVVTDDTTSDVSTDTNTSGQISNTEDSSGVGSNRDIDVSVLVADESIILGNDSIDVLSNTPALITVNVDDAEDIVSAEVFVDDIDYTLEDAGDDSYSASIILPSNNSVVTVVIKYDDGIVSTDIVDIKTQSTGWVYEVIGNEETAVSGAVVIVYEADNLISQWDAYSYGQSNPVVVGNNGSFAWYVPNGIYVVTVGKSGYEDAKATLYVHNNILAPAIELVLKEKAVVDTEDKISGEDFIEKPVLATTIAHVAKQAIQTIDEFRNSPEVQVAADITKPIVIAAAIGSAGVLSSSFNLLVFLRYLFSSPVLFFARRKRKRFGIVYNAITKMPVDLAIVRLYSETGKLVKTIVTDEKGHYIFTVSSGRYLLKVTKRGFDFPSSYLSGKKVDGEYLDVYSGGIIKVTDKDVVISANIPIDPSQTSTIHTPKKILLIRFLRTIQHILALSGLFLAIVVVFIQPVLFSFILLFIHISVYLITRILIKTKKKKGWGIVTSVDTGKPITNAIVRLFEPKYNKLIESTLTDGKGRYSFLVGPNEYFITFDKGGYKQTEVRPINYSSNKESKVISVNVKLNKIMV